MHNISSSNIAWRMSRNNNNFSLARAKNDEKTLFHKNNKKRINFILSPHKLWINDYRRLCWSERGQHVMELLCCCAVACTNTPPLFLLLRCDAVTKRCHDKRVFASHDTLFTVSLLEVHAADKTNTGDSLQWPSVFICPIGQVNIMLLTYTWDCFRITPRKKQHARILIITGGFFPSSGRDSPDFSRQSPGSVLWWYYTTII